MFTGHHNGVITLDLAEGDDVHREQLRVAMDEPYRTLLGHFRHEVGHYYFYRLVARHWSTSRGFNELFGVGVAEQLAEPLRVVLRRLDQPVEVVMPDLVAEMAEQRAVRLVHRHPQLLAVHVVALGEIQCDHAVVVTGEHLLGLTGKQVERQTEIRVLVAPDDRQLRVRAARRSAGALPSRRRRTPPCALVSESLGRVRVSAHDVHSLATGAFSTSQLHSARCRFAHNWYLLWHRRRRRARSPRRAR